MRKRYILLLIIWFILLVAHLTDPARAELFNIANSPKTVPKGKSMGFPSFLINWHEPLPTFNIL
jgi:hypothetical protein